MTTKEEIEDQIKSIARKRDKTFLELNEYQKQLQMLADQFKEVSEDFVKVVCPTCEGVGYIEDKDKKKHVCDNQMIPEFSCRGKQYIWMRKYEKKNSKK
jgi:hypothetical protein